MATPERLSSTPVVAQSEVPSNRGVAGIGTAVSKKGNRMDEGLELLPSAAELVWGVVSLAILVGLIVLLSLLLVRAKRRTREQDEAVHRLERRLGDLEQRVTMEG